MASSPATTTDLTNRSLRTLTDREIEVGATLLEDAYNLIVSARPTVDTRLDAATPVPAFEALVVQIQCAMVLRVLSNPDGKLEEQGDTYRYRLDQARSTGALYVSDAELARLAEGDAQSDGAFTIHTATPTTPGYWATPDTWVPIV
jgi:Phage protein Gp19/Gp15/Gp42